MVICDSGPTYNQYTGRSHSGDGVYIVTPAVEQAAVQTCAPTDEVGPAWTI
jgi:hypothetical protein